MKVSELMQYLSTQQPEAEAVRFDDADLGAQGKRSSSGNLPIIDNPGVRGRVRRKGAVYLAEL